MTTEIGVNIPIILAPKLMSHACELLIDNVGNYLYLNNGRIKSEVDPHQFNLRLHHFSQFQRKKKKKKDFQKLAGLWLACEMVDHIGIYWSKVAEGLLAFQRRSCFFVISFVKFKIRFSPVEHSICHILGMVGPIDVKQKGNESTGCYTD